jgi:hypothetical protein
MTNKNVTAPRWLACLMMTAVARSSRTLTPVLGTLLLLAAACGRTDVPTGSATAPTRTVTIYVSTDRVFEPVLRRMSGFRM